MTALRTVVVGRVLGDLRRGALVVKPLVAGVLLYGHVAALVDLPVRLQQAGWVGLVVIAAIGALRLGERTIGRLDAALVRIALILIAVTLVSIVPNQLGALGDRATLVPAERPLATTTTAPRRDVYWLVFDRYGSDRSLELMYGVRNDLGPWLDERGFTVLSDSHANYVKTQLSMATTLV